MNKPPGVGARPAATVVVLREGRGAGFEVLLMRRNVTVAFMAGAYVFPGGRLDAADRNRPAEAAFLQASSRFVDLTPEEEWSHRVAAVRELAEEASLVLLARDLVPMAHWVTPEAEPRRYDTRFFLTTVGQDQVVRHDGVETTAFGWMSPSTALARCRTGEVPLPPPTWATLRQLEPHRSVDDAVAWARATPIVRVMPSMAQSEGRKMLVLPGDPLLPALEGWPTPGETRFVLTEGLGWQPTVP
jgi:8-oxo-dGTP pyrophosphatase MutT (NUDIX family)